MATEVEKIAIGIFLASCAAYTVYAQSSVNCSVTGAGRFPNLTDATCQKYTYCIAIGNGLYVSYNYTCPGTSVFNPNTSQCTAPTNYVCKVAITSVCTADGFFPDPTVTDCSSYIGCVKIDGVFLATKYPCQANTYYNPSTTLCEATYVCPSSSTFKCTATGRFANSTDLSCKSYYLCVMLSNGEFKRYEYTCPGSSVFSPGGVCTTSYRCPTASG